MKSKVKINWLAIVAWFALVACIIAFWVAWFRRDLITSILFGAAGSVCLTELLVEMGKVKK